MGSGQRPLFNIQVVDALSYQGILIDLMSEGLTQDELNEEDYNEELENSGWSDQGRDLCTGY